MILSCFFFSILAGLIKFLGNDVHAFQQAFFRNIFSIVIIAPFVLFYKIKIFKTDRLWLLILRSFFGSLTMIFLFLSYTLIPLSQAVAISFTTPLFIFLGGIIFFKEKINTNKITALLFGFIFTILALKPSADMSIGSLIALFAAFFHSIAGLIVKELTKTESILSLMFFMIIFMSGFTVLPAYFYWETPQVSGSWIILFLLALVGTLGNYFWTSAISKDEVTTIMPFDYTKLIFATLIGLLFFEEKIETLILFSGFGIVICNMILLKSTK